jgi:hypothetical protein
LICRRILPAGNFKNEPEGFSYQSKKPAHFRTLAKKILCGNKVMILFNLVGSTSDKPL